MLDVVLRDLGGRQSHGYGINHIVNCPNCFNGVRDDEPGRVYGGVVFLRERPFGSLTLQARTLKDGENHVSRL
jgi:hypothetical protein